MYSVPFIEETKNYYVNCDNILCNNIFEIYLLNIYVYGRPTF